MLSTARPTLASYKLEMLCACREPLYAYAETSCWWELVLLASHAHPSVSAFARTLLSGVHVVYDGDPLKDLTLPTFLDKFVQRKPKVCLVLMSEGFEALVGVADVQIMSKHCSYLLLRLAVSVTS